MTKAEAAKEAREIAREDNIVMAVTFDPYDEHAESDADKYGYMPFASTHIFEHEKVVETIQPPRDCPTDFCPHWPRCLKK